MLVISFDEILTAAMNDVHISVRTLEELLKENGVTSINFRRISEYKNGKHAPTYENAKRILEVLDYSIPEENLIESLRLVKEKILDHKDKIEAYGDRSSIRKTIRIKLEKIIPNEEPEVVQRYLEERLEGLYGTKDAFSTYVQDLIAKDMNEYIITEEEINNE